MYASEQKLNNSLESKIDWKPLKTSGGNGIDRRFEILNSYQAKFKPTLFAIFLRIVALFVSISITAGFVYNYIIYSADAPPELLLYLTPAFIVCAFFMIIVLFAIKSVLEPIQIDKQKNLFWKGWGMPKDKYFTSKKTRFAFLNQVLALQLLGDYFQGKHSYYCFELNMILNDGSRVNVIKQGGYDQIHTDAKSLSQFLGVPVLDRTSPQMKN